MALTRTLKNSFAGGEMSPLLRGRTDQQRYFISLDTCVNWIPNVQGGASVRPGTIYAGAAKGATAVRLIPFIFSATDALILEFGNLYVRFWRFNATTGLPEAVGAPLDIVTPYTTAQLAAIQFTQSADVLFLTHPSQPPAALSRTAADSSAWTYSALGFNPPPTYQAGQPSTTTLYSSAATGNAVTLTAGAAFFLLGDVGRLVNVTVQLAGKQTGQAVALITAFTSSTAVTANILQGSFPLVAAPAASGTWWLGGSPGTGIDILTTAAGAFTFAPGVGQLVQLQSMDATSTLTDGFRSTDNGSYVHVQGGTVLITAFVNAQKVNGIVVSAIRDFSTTVHFAPAGTWSLEVPTWTAARGYPAAVGIHQQRVIYGGAGGEPDSIRATVTGDYYNFTPGTHDDQALNLVLATQQVNAIQWILGLQNLAVGGLGRVFYVGPHAGTAVTPTTPSVNPQSGGGATSIAPGVLESFILFVMRGQRQVGELAFSFADDAGVISDLTEWANHLTLDVATAGDMIFTQNAVQEQPVPVAWYVRADGTLCGLTYRRLQKMLAWHRQTTFRGATQDTFESVAVIPNPVSGKDQLWVSVVRGALHTIEVFDGAPGIPHKTRTMDASTVYSGAAVATITGLAYLNGLTVGIRGQDAAGNWWLFPDQVVAGGQVTGLVPSLTWAEVGLRFTATMVTPRLANVSSDALQGRVKSFGQGKLRTYNTVALKVQKFLYPSTGWYDSTKPSQYPATRLSPVADDRDLDFGQMGVDTDGRITITQDLPLGGTVTMFSAEVEIGH